MVFRRMLPADIKELYLGPSNMPPIADNPFSDNFAPVAHYVKVRRVLMVSNKEYRLNGVGRHQTDKSPYLWLSS